MMVPVRILESHACIVEITRIYQGNDSQFVRGRFLQRLCLRVHYPDRVMRSQTNRENRFAALRARYDSAFAVLCHATRELDRCKNEGATEQQLRDLRRAVELSQRAYTHARNELATCLLDRLGLRIAGFYWGFEYYRERQERIAC